MVLGPWVHPPLHLWVSSAPRATAWIQGSKSVLSSPLQWFPGGFQSMFQNYSDDRFVAPRENGYRQAGAESGGPSARTSSRVSPVGAARLLCVFPVHSGGCGPCHICGSVVPCGFWRRAAGRTRCLDKESRGQHLITESESTDVLFLRTSRPTSCCLLLLLMAAVEMMPQSHVASANGFPPGVFTPHPLPCGHR